MNIDREIIELVRTVMDNGTGVAETPNEHVLIKLMQLRGTPMTSFKFDQERVEFHYRKWAEDKGFMKKYYIVCKECGSRNITAIDGYFDENGECPCCNSREFNTVERKK